MKTKYNKISQREKELKWLNERIRNNIHTTCKDCQYCIKHREKFKNVNRENDLWKCRLTYKLTWLENICMYFQTKTEEVQ